MGTILLIIILVILFWPAIKVAITVHRLKRNARNAYEQMFNQAGGASPRSNQERERRGGWSQAPAAKRKKIGRDVGEYVKFEEIEYTSTTQSTASGESSATRTDFKTEQQIVDADWTDIP